MTTDPSAGWEAVADRFIAVRSTIGAETVRSWARERLPASAAVLDIGCGSGVPIALGLAEDGFSVWGVDASPSLIAAYQHHLPNMPTACEAVQDSSFFGRTFIGVIAIGLVFLLNEADQRRLLQRVASVLEPGGRFLFSAPLEVCAWQDVLTGCTSISLGADAYSAELLASGLELTACHADEGGNNYYEAVKLVEAPPAFAG